MKVRPTISLIAALCLPACTNIPSTSPGDFPTLMTAKAGLTSTTIIENAYGAAGGLTWTRPKSLSMDGYAVFYKDGLATKNETHKMWRVYDWGKTAAHQVDGKVRIWSVRDGKDFYHLSYDGKTTYTAKGSQPKTEDDKRWASSFGFGVIRHALDAGYKTERLPDDLIDGRPAYLVRVIDQAGSTTQFGIAQDDYAVLKVGFETERGWHERIYSDFFKNPGEVWVQPGRVRLYYKGVKANEVIWTSFAINKDLPNCLFVLPVADSCETGF